MKTTLGMGCLLLALAACSDDGDLGGGGTNPPGTNTPGTNTPGGTDNGRPEETVTGDITADRTFTKDKNWLLTGRVNVKAGATLTIEAGTVIKGDNASKAILLVEPGAKINAVGTADEPIVFTSQAADGAKAPGQWGGILILGKAPINVRDAGGESIQASVEGILEKGATGGTLYGGDDPEDSSGTLSYVRIEYSGVVISTDNEVNGITFAGVGRGTKVDHIQVRQTLDDCFEFFGGTVDAKYLACQGNQDDGFDFDLGYTGRLQFLVLQQDPNHAGDDNGFESDNDEKGTASEPLTAPTVFNATIIGKNKSVSGSQYGLLLRKNTRGTYGNIVVQGFQAAMDIRDGIGAAGDLLLDGMACFGSYGAGTEFPVQSHIAFTEDKTMPDGLSDADKATYKARLDFVDDTVDEVAFYNDGEDNITTDPGLVKPFDRTAPVFGPAVSLSTTVAPPSDDFFDATATYRGAFKDQNDAWATTGKWAVWSDK